MFPQLGARGGGWVALQFVLMAAIVVLGAARPGLGESRAGGSRAPEPCSVLAGARRRARRACARLRVHAVPETGAGGRSSSEGPYAVVRHPVYSGGLLVCVGHLARALAVGARRAVRARRRLGAQGAGRGALPRRALSGLRGLLRAHALPPRPVRLLTPGGRLRAWSEPGRSRWSGCPPSFASRESRRASTSSPTARPSAQDAADAAGCELDQIVKSLVLRLRRAAGRRASSRATAACDPEKVARAVAASVRPRGEGARGGGGDRLRARRGRAVPAPEDRRRR